MISEQRTLALKNILSKLLARGSTQKTADEETARLKQLLSEITNEQHFTEKDKT
jgi:hypothetical protein